MTVIDEETGIYILNNAINIQLLVFVMEILTCTHQSPICEFLTFLFICVISFMIIKTLVCLSARQILSQGPSILFWPINLDTVLTGGWDSSASAPPLHSRLFEALMMMNVPTFGTSSKSMQMPL